MPCGRPFILFDGKLDSKRVEVDAFYIRVDKTLFLSFQKEFISVVRIDQIESISYDAVLVDITSVVLSYY